ncbi:MAG TPA: hypothetical protein GXZ93_00305 [Actinobacteria bacterium]|nr:hypothetical protein [Actinomycetota bacterium]
MRLFDYKEDNKIGHVLLEKQIKKNESGLRKYSVRFKSPFLTGFSENDMVNGEYIDGYNDKKRKCIILLHGFKSVDGKLAPYYSFAEQAVESGFSCFFMNLPFHLERTPFSKKSGEVLLNNDDSGMLDFFHQAVVDAKKAINILKKEFPVENFYICGLSLGGMCSVFIKAFERRVEKAVLVECGGNWHEIYWNSFMSKIILKGKYLREGKIEKEKSALFYSFFPEFIREFKKIYGRKQENFCDLHEIQNSCLNKYLNPKWFLSDPITWAHRIKRDESLIISSRFDPLFNKKTIMQLKKELGDPEIIWINRFHTSDILKNRRLNAVIFNYLDRD